MAKSATFACCYGASADTVLARIRASGGVVELVDVENMLKAKDQLQGLLQILGRQRRVCEKERLSSHGDNRPRAVVRLCPEG